MNYVCLPACADCIAFDLESISHDFRHKYSEILSASLKVRSQIIDDPSNGMLLEFNTKQAFDTFAWCFQKTEVYIYLNSSF